MRFAAQQSEYALYALLLAQPILGLLWTNAYGDRVNLFFLGQLPALIGRDRPLARQLGEAHVTVGLLLLGLIAAQQADCASRRGRALPPFLAPRRHAQSHAAETNEAPGRAGLPA